jgi:DNA-binding NarL/FixJ family response regulator
MVTARTRAAGRRRELVVVIRVVVVDDEPLVRTGLAVLLDAEDDLEVVGEADDGTKVVDLVRRARPDVVLMDVRMPAADGITATEALLRRLSDPPRIVVLTTFEHDDYVYGALRAGASAFLLKRSRPADIVAAIRLVHAGEALLFPAAIRALAATQPTTDTAAVRRVERLTDRERAILTLVSRGLSNAEIANAEHVSVETVKTHVSAVLRKLEARDRTQAVIAAYDGGLVHPRQDERQHPDLR